MRTILIFMIAILATTYVSAASIVIDPGHSPKSQGALSSSGISEYKYNDELCADVVRFLKSRNMSVEITREPNQNLDLFGRTKNTDGKKLFISIHHDSVQPQFIKTVNNFPVSNKAHGFSIFISTKNKYYKESLQYAIELGKNLLQLGLTPSTHHGENIPGENRTVVDAKLGIYNYDDLIVLKTAKCPALLLEAGVIVHPQEETLVKTTIFRKKIGEAIYSAVKNE